VLARCARLPAYPPSAKYVSVDNHIENYDEEPQQKLDLSSQCRGVEHREDVVLDEIAGITRAACLAAQPVLERRERADPARKLDGGSPQGRWDVDVRHPWPPQDQQSAEDDEHHEDEVNGDDEICENGGQRNKRVRRL